MSTDIKQSPVSPLKDLSNNQMFSGWYKTLRSPILPEDIVADQPDDEHPSLRFTDRQFSPPLVVPAEMDIVAKHAKQHTETVNANPTATLFASKDTVSSSKPIAENVPERDKIIPTRLSIDKVKARIARRKALRKKQLKFRAATAEQALNASKPLPERTLERHRQTPYQESSSDEDDTMIFSDPVLSKAAFAPRDTPDNVRSISKLNPLSSTPSTPRPVNKESPAIKRPEVVHSKLRDGGPLDLEDASENESVKPKGKEMDLEGSVLSHTSLPLKLKLRMTKPAKSEHPKRSDRGPIALLDALHIGLDLSQDEAVELGQYILPNLAGLASAGSPAAKRIATLRKKLRNAGQGNQVEALASDIPPHEEMDMEVDGPVASKPCWPINFTGLKEVLSKSKKESRRTVPSRVGKKMGTTPRPTTSQRIKLEPTPKSRSGSGVTSGSGLQIKSETKMRFKARRRRRTQLELLHEAAGPGYERETRTRSRQYYENILDMLMAREVEYRSGDEE